ncbi:uncharacterized protein LOC129572886 [Sitodiplosis mosellana]|uniref:uncharacterized protein LOC129572886 n=1 Tax=Sitodiplosis mosellana TaxID=263140 RepID=UPI002444280F|nr:uncharacterized protein LOC129572886 [Sitodiplosis mosellana]
MEERLAQMRQNLGLANPIQNEQEILPEAEDTIETIDTIQTIEMIEIDKVETVETVYPIAMDTDENDPIPMDSDENDPLYADEPEAMEVRAVANVQMVEANDVLNTQRLNIRRLSASMPQPMATIKEENETDSDKENRHPDKEN